MTIAYDGSRYQGWQRQPDTDLTIQGTLERVLSELKGFPVEVDGSGRTDGGVHAQAQTASILLPGKVEEELLRQEMNGALPGDIRVTDVMLVKNGFHARYSAKGKCYEYTIDTREKADVFTRKYCYHFPEPLDIEAMERAAGYLIGRNDFAAFTDRNEDQSTVRTIYDIRIEVVKGGLCGNRMQEPATSENAGRSNAVQGGKIKIIYKGNGFMYHMVRILTGTLLEVGTGKRTTEDVKALLERGERWQAGFLAPACGLSLKEVYY